MPIKSLDAFATERRLFKPQALSGLNGSILGIDADHYLSVISALAATYPPVVVGGSSLAPKVRDVLLRDLATLKSHKITPYFVFRGLPAASANPHLFKQYDLQHAEMRSQRRQAAWNQYEAASTEAEHATLAAFHDSGLNPVTASAAVFRSITGLLAENNVEYSVAPYYAWAQLAYLLSTERIDSVLGPSELLLAPHVDKILVTMDDKNASVLHKKALLQELGGLTNELFVEVALAAGCDLTGNYTFPPFEHPINVMGQPTTPIKTAAESLAQYPSVYTAVGTYGADQGIFAARFRRAFAALKFCPVLHADGHVGPLSNTGDVPNDSHDFLGQRLPDELIYYQNAGLIGPDLLSVIVSGFAAEEAGLDGDADVEYRTLVKKLPETYSKCLNLITQSLHRYYHYKKYNIVYFWQPETENSLNSQFQPALYVGLNWKTEKLESLSSKPVSAVNVSSVLDLISNSSADWKKASLTPDHTVLLSTNTQILANTILRLLQLEGYIDPKTHILTKWGEVLQAFGNEPAALPILSLLRNKLLDNKPLTPQTVTAFAPSASPLLLKVAGFVNTTSGTYRGRFSRQALALSSIASTQTRATRWLLEATLFSLLSYAADKGREASVYELGRALPFATLPSSITGNVIDQLLRGAALEDVAKVCYHGDSATKIVTEQLAQFKAVWQSLFAAVEKAHKLDLVSADVHKQFVEANDVCKNKL